MSLNAKNLPKKPSSGNKVKQKVLDAGTYPGRLVQLIDLGLQPQRAFEGKDKAPAHEIMFTYELVDEFMVDEDGKELEDKPRWISETLPFYGLDQEKAKSTQRYNALDPQAACDGDFAATIGAPVNVTLIQKPNKKDAESPYINVSGITAVRPKDAARFPELVNEPKVFDLDAPDLKTFESLPEWIRDKITSNLNFKGSALEKLLGGEKAVDKKADEKAKKETPPAVEAEDDDAPW